MNGLAPRCALVCVLWLVCGMGPAVSQTQDMATKFRHAQALEQAGDMDRATALYLQLHEADPANIVYFDAVQRTLLQLKRYDDLIALLDRRLERQPADINLLGTLGSVHYKAGRDLEAQEAWERAVAVSPRNPQSYRIIAAVQLDNRLLDKAAETYRRGRTACGDQNLFILELAQLLSASMDYRGATEEYLRWMQMNPTQIGFVQSRMGSYTWKEEGRIAAMEVVGSAMQGSDDVRLLELLAWLAMEGKDYQKAFDVYRDIDRISRANGTAVYTFADRAYKERAYEVAARAYQEALSLSLPQAKVPYARYGYALALREEAASADTLLSPLLPGLRARSGVRARYADAIVAFRSVIDQHPRSEVSAKSHYHIGVILGDVYADLDGAREAFERVGDEVPGLPLLRYDVALRMGSLFLREGDTARATQQFSIVAAASDALPDQNDEAQFRLAEIDYFGGRFREAMDRLGTIAANLKADYANDALELQAFLEDNVRTAPVGLVACARADLLARQRSYSEAIAVLDSAIMRHPARGVVDDILQRKAAFLVASGRYVEAIAACEQLLEDQTEAAPLADRAQFRIGEIYEFGLRESAKAVAAYEKLLVDYPRSVLGSLARKRIRHLRGDA